MNNQKPAVVYIITKLELGGAQKVCLALFKHLSKKNVNTFLISGEKGPLIQQIHDKKHVFLLYNLKREASFFTLIAEIKSFFSIVCILRKLKRSHPRLIVHTHSTKAGYMGRWAAWCVRIKTRIHTVHGFGFHPHQKTLSYIIAFALEQITSLITTCYVCVSEYDIAVGKKYIPFFKNKNRLIRAGIDEKPLIKIRAAPYPCAKKTFVFGTISCFKKQKNLFDLLNAFEQVHAHNIYTKLCIIGDGILRNDIESWIDTHRLHNAITLHGWKFDIKPHLLSWHTFVLTSLWEGLPCSIIEARTIGLPIIAYRVGGISDIIIHRKNGLLCHLKDLSALTQDMKHIASSKNLHHALATHKDNLHDFYISTMINQHHALYKESILTTSPS